MKGKAGRPKRQFTKELGLNTILSREIFSAYVSRADKIVIIQDSDYLVRMVNEYGAKILGTDGRELTGSRWIDRFIPEEEREKFWQELNQFFLNQEVGPLRNTALLNTSEGLKVFSWQHFGVRRSAGSALAVLSVGEDISGQKAMEATLARRNGILKALSLAANDFLTASPKTWEEKVLIVLETLRKARGSERVYMVKNRFENDQELMFLKYECKISEAGKVFTGEESQLLTYKEANLTDWRAQFIFGKPVQLSLEKDKPRGWNIATEALSVTAIPVYVDDYWWGYLGFEDWHEQAVPTDEEIEALKAVAVTFGAAIRRKRTEEALEAEKKSVEARVVERTGQLKEEKARLTASIHSLSLGFVMTDLASEVVLYNHAVGEILGQVEGTWTKQKLQERLGVKIDLEVKLIDCMEKMEEINLPALAVGDKYIRLNFTPIRMVEDDGRVIGAVLLIADETEAKKLQLSRDEFFAVAAHELRTPLSAISGNASTIVDYFARDIDNTEIAEMVDDIQKSARRLIAIVNEYLDISRLELNKMEIKPERFELAAEIRGIMDELKEQARVKGLTWEMGFGLDFEVWVQADREHARQAVINLLGNAIKYTDLGGVRVELDSEGSRVKVRVKDSGKGVAAEEQVQLFQKFKRVGDRVYAKDVVEGTGMGLYITRLLMEAMGGKVYLEVSELGKGSTFVLEFDKA